MLFSLIEKEARQEGFPLVGGVDLEPALDFFQAQHHKRYEAWIRDEKHGEMHYLEKGMEARKDPRSVFPNTKSVISVALPYSTEPAGEVDPAHGPRYARYMRGEDYHRKIPRMLHRVMMRVCREWDSKKEGALHWKICSDKYPILERSWAALSGLGWIGKNTLLIHPQYGSYLLLGEVLLNQELGRLPQELPSYCGNCTRCLNFCPTEALDAISGMDSKKCISYLTLEQRGKIQASEGVQKKMGNWVAGCDLCQEVCPFNRKAMQKEFLSAQAGGAEKSSRSSKSCSSDSSGAISLKSWKELLEETEAEYRKRVMDSSLNRVKWTDFQRNLGISLGNSFKKGDFPNDILMLLEGKVRNEEDQNLKENWQAVLSLASKL
jgi:epoxyqueuosine reductase